MGSTAKKMIMVGVDGSPEAAAAVRYAVHVAEQTGEEALLAHAHESWPQESFDLVVEAFRRQSEESAREVLRAAAEPYANEPVAIRTPTRRWSGRPSTHPPSWSLCRRINTLRAGCVRPRTLGKRMHCPLLVVPAWVPVPEIADGQMAGTRIHPTIERLMT